MNSERKATMYKSGLDFFLIAYPRSGSSLLRLILNTHPDVCVPPEASFLTYFKDKYPEKLSSKEKSDLAREIYTSRKFEHWGLELTPLLEEMERTDSIHYSDVATIPYRQYCTKELKGDKNNVNWTHLEWLQSEFPSALFLVLVRDPVAIYQSLKALGHLSNRKYAPSVPPDAKTFSLDFLRYASEITNLMSKGREQVRLLDYSDLVRQPENTTGEIARFLGVREEFDTDTFYQTVTEPSDLLDWKALTKMPIQKERALSPELPSGSLESTDLQNARERYHILSNMCK